MTQHGGRRAGAGRPPGIPNPNAGRPQTVKRIRVGQQYFLSRKRSDGYYGATELWEIVAVSRTEITVKSDNGDTISLRLG